MPTTRALIRAGIDSDVDQHRGHVCSKAALLAELCEKQKCDVLCVQETHRGLKAIRPNIRGMSLVAESPHEQYGSAIFVRNNCICDSTSTSNTNNVEIIQAQLNKLTVTSVYKPPNEQFSFGSNLASTQMNVVIGDFNSHGVEWGYRSTDEKGRLVEQWSETNQLSLVHDAKQPKSFNSKRWRQGYNPDLAFVSYSIAHLAEKDVMDAIPKTQHRPISIKLNSAIRPRNVPFRRPYNMKKAKWQSYAKEVDNGIANTNPVPENYEKFVNLVRRSSNKNIPRGCRTSYVCGLNDQSKDMYEDYQRRFAEDPFNEDTVRVGDGRH